MIAISNPQRKELEAVGLLRHRETRSNPPQDPNFVVVNKEHRGKNKKTYVVEEFDVLVFLEKYDHPLLMKSLQKIRRDQLQTLKDKGLVSEKNIQNSGEYNPGASVFISENGQIRCKKATNYMLALGIWKSNSNKRAE